MAVGLASAAVVRRCFGAGGRLPGSTDREAILVALTGFVAHQAAEQAGLSGVFAVFFCGLTMSHYTWHSLNATAKARACGRSTAPAG